MRLCPRIRHHKNGTASLHGIPASDLHSILTAARLHYYDAEGAFEKKQEEEKAKADANEHGMGQIILRNMREDRMWVSRQETTLDLAKKLHDAKRLEKYSYSMRPLHTLTAWQIKERRKKVLGDRAFRKRFDAMMAGLKKPAP